MLESEDVGSWLPLSPQPNSPLILTGFKVLVNSSLQDHPDFLVIELSLFQLQIYGLKRFLNVYINLMYSRSFLNTSCVKAGKLTGVLLIVPHCCC